MKQAPNPTSGAPLTSAPETYFFLIIIENLFCYKYTYLRK